MKVNLTKILSFVFIFLSIIALIYINLSKPRIFVLHSYDVDYSWVRDIDSGLKRVFNKNQHVVRYHYMNTKRNPSIDFKERAGRAATEIIRQWRPNILIAVDDDAQKYAAIHFKNDPFIKIVFTGMNAELSEYGYDKADNVTGMLERIQFSAFKEVFLQILPPEKRKVVHIADSSTTSKFIQEEVEKVDWSPLILIETILCNTLDEWKAAVARAEKTADILFITHYHTIKNSTTDGLVIKPKKIIEMTEPYLKIPAIGSWGFYVEDGGMMAVAVSPFEQGEAAAKMAIEIIDKKKSPKDIPILISKQFVIYVREESLKKRNIVLPYTLEAFARATNNFFEEEEKK